MGAGEKGGFYVAGAAFASQRADTWPVFPLRFSIYLHVQFLLLPNDFQAR